MEVIQIFEQTPPPPCERLGGCLHFDRCADEKLACNAFAQYLARANKSTYIFKKPGLRANPTHEMFLKLDRDPFTGPESRKKE